MKSKLRKAFAFILTPLESGEDAYHYKPSHRTILYAMSALLILLVTLMVVFGGNQITTYLFPVILFGGGALLCLIVAALGTDRAVAKIWGGGRK